MVCKTWGTSGVTLKSGKFAERMLLLKNPLKNYTIHFRKGDENAEKAWFLKKQPIFHESTVVTVSCSYSGVPSGTVKNIFGSFWI